MRPEQLNPIFASVTALKGVGPRIAKLLEKLTGPLVVDLLWHLPSGLIDRRFRPKIAELEDGRIATVVVDIEKHYPSLRRGLPHRVRCSDDTGFLTLVFFNPRKDYLSQVLPEGSERIISGQVGYYDGEAQISHPDHIVAPDEIESLPLLEPVYPLTAGLTAKPLAKGIAEALTRVPALAEWQTDDWRQRHEWLDFNSALQKSHKPGNLTDLSADAPERARLAYDELLAHQLALSMVRAHQRGQPGYALTGDGGLRQGIIAALPYQLTKAQQRVGKEIAGDMEQSGRMLRLLQGDVGSGKTVVALLAMALAVEAGFQSVLMAPTELLARQHYQDLEPICRDLGLRVMLLTGRDKGRERETKLSDLADGGIAIAIGTHALFQDDVNFHKLGLAVIDEQHRFGVHQRLLLGTKGRAVDVLVMTATPIPRTLAMTVYGDMEVSKLDEKPPGRSTIDTRAMPISRVGDVSQSLRRAIAEGAQIYWVCPLVEESDLLDVAAAEERYAMLQRQYGDQAGLIHGRMKAVEKDTAMARFIAGDCKILVATTVIEVGVNVTSATIMIVEHSERFGLAQLHQLRGRVGRGDKPGRCLLLYSEPLGDNARARLKVMRETDDGFRIAEEDLKLRGVGEILGTRQSGFPDFRIADPVAHSDFLAVAHDDARLILNRDPDLLSDRGAALRSLLYLFQKDASIKYLKAG